MMKYIWSWEPQPFTSRNVYWFSFWRKVQINECNIIKNIRFTYNHQALGYEHLIYFMEVYKSPLGIETMTSWIGNASPQKRQVIRSFHVPSRLCHSVKLEESNTLIWRHWNARVSEYPRIHEACNYTLITRFMGSTWGPPESCRPQVGPI